MLLNAEKFQGYRCYHLWVIKRKKTGGGDNITPHPLRVGLRVIQSNINQIVV